MCGGRQVQRPQPLDHPRDRPLGVPRGQLAGHRGDLDRDVVDVGPLDQGGHPGEPRGGLPLPQHRLAQQVQVQPEPVGARAGEVLGQPRSVVGDQVADEDAQPLARGRHDDRRQHRPDPRPEPEHRLVGPAEEPRGRRRQLGQLARGDPDVLRPGDPVDEPHGELEPGGVGDERREPPGRLALATGLSLGGRREPLPRQPDRVVRDVLRHAAPSSGIRSSLCPGQPNGQISDPFAAVPRPDRARSVDTDGSPLGPPRCRPPGVTRCPT